MIKINNYKARTNNTIKFCSTQKESNNLRVNFYLNIS